MRAGQTTDVVIVGLGPVGAVLAALLGERGIRVVVLDAQSAVTPYPRAIAADGETLRTLLDVLGPAARTLFLLDRSVQVRDGRQRLLTTITFPSVADGARNPTAQPGLSFFHQPAIERALRARLAQLPSVRLRLGVALRAIRDEPGAVVAVLEDGSTVRASWLVGCDGAASSVRRARGIAYAGRTFAQPWLVVDLDSPRPLPGLDSFRYVLDPTRPAVVMPRPGGHRVEFMLGVLTRMRRWWLAGGQVQRLLEPYLAALPDRAGVRVSRATGYTFHARQAERWRDGRVLLAGDAAHSMPPFGGQGLGAGIADAAALSWRLAEVCAGFAPPAVLDGYAAEQRPRVQAMTRTALTIGRLLTPTNRGSATLTRAAIRAVSTAPVVGRRFRAGQLRAVAGVPVPSGERARSGGVPLPNPRVRTTDGTLHRLDELLARRWTVLGLDGDPRDLVSPAAVQALTERGAAFHSLGGPDADLVDLDGTLVALWPGRCAGGRVLIARPDRVVAAVGTAHEVEDVLARLTGGTVDACESCSRSGGSASTCW